MKSVAAIDVGLGKPLVVDEIEIPDPRPDQVIVKLYSSGVCHSQLHQMHNSALERPMTLGHEGTGVVTHVGSDVTHVKAGDMAIVTWVPRTARQGRWAPEPSGVTYREEEVSGSVYTWGQDVLTTGEYVVKVDDDVPKDVSSIVGCAILTGSGAVLHTAGVKPEDSVAIWGVGGVGIAAVQMASILEAYPIIAVDLDDTKLEFAKSMGATHTVNAATEDPIARVIELSNGGVDYSFDAIGFKITTEQILPVTRSGGSGAENHGGMAVLIGMPQADQEMTIWPGHFMFHQRRYRGSLGATYPDKDFPMYLRLHREGKLRLDDMVTRRYKLEDINQACNDLQAGEITGRAIIEYDV